jgi:hypothetical protein
MKKVNKHQVRRIRDTYYGAEDVSLEFLSNKYDVTKSCISSIVQGETWKHVGGPTSPDPDNGHITPTRKVSDIQREKIKQRRDNGESLESIASDYPIGKTQVCNITTGDGDSDFCEDLELDRTIDLPLTEYDFVSEVSA